MKYTVVFPEGDGTWSCFDCATRAEAEEEAEHFSLLFVGWSTGSPEPDEYEGEAELIVEDGEELLEHWVYKDGLALYDKCDVEDEDNPLNYGPGEKFFTRSPPPSSGA